MEMESLSNNQMRKKGTAERAPTSCKWSKNQPEGKWSQFSNNQVPAKGTAERALTICKSSKDLAEK